jgi:hypothetical protein
MKHDRCERCLFWDSSASADVDYDTGQCRRMPPGFDDRTSLAVWPFTEDTDWCGEFKADPDFVDEHEPAPSPADLVAARREHEQDWDAA